ncbi:hypothetical protein HG530_004168 [Fusarium avenaceum]|nr:hypothetical protein HG530_004168 [Fusarium avenaceum]
MADSILAPDLDVGQVDGQILATSFAKGVIGITEGNSLGSDAVAASWKVAGEYLGNIHDTNARGLGLEVFIVEGRVHESFHIRARNKLQDPLSEGTHRTRALRLKTTASHNDVSSFGTSGVGGSRLGSWEGRAQSYEETQKGHESDHGYVVVGMKAFWKKIRKIDLGELQ